MENRRRLKINITSIDDHYNDHVNFTTHPFQISKSEISSVVPMLLLEKQEELDTILSVMEDTTADDALCKISFFKISLDYIFYDQLQSVTGIKNLDEEKAHEKMYKMMLPTMQEAVAIRTLSTNCSYEIANLVDAVHNRATPYNVLNNRPQKP